MTACTPVSVYFKRILTCLHLTENDMLVAVIILFVCLFRAFEEESKARLGLVECAKHELVQPFTVLYEKEGDQALCFCHTAHTLVFFLSALLDTLI